MGSRPLRVLHLITDLGKGGAERFLVDLCGELDRRDDVEFAIGALYDDNRYEHYTEGFPIIPLHYETFSLRGSNECPAYRRLLDEFRPHVVHTHRFLAEFLSAQYVSPGRAYVCHGHDNMVQLANARPATFLDREALTNWIEKRYLIHRKYRRAPTTFIANSTHTRRYYESVLPRSLRPRVRLLPYGFDYRRFEAPRLRDLRRGEPLRLVNVGSFQDKKNQIFIVDIARGLRDAGLDFRVDLLGDGHNRPRVQEAVERDGLEDRVTLHGNVDRVEEWLHRAHVYLHTAWYEPFGLVLLEAMAAGLPCVVLDGKGNRDLVQDGKNGFFLEEEDAGLFVARIRTLAEDPALYRRMAESAQAHAQDYDIGKATERFVGLYRALSEEASGTAG